MKSPHSGWGNQWTEVGGRGATKGRQRYCPPICGRLYRATRGEDPARSPEGSGPSLPQSFYITNSIFHFNFWRKIGFDHDDSWQLVRYRRMGRTLSLAWSSANTSLTAIANQHVCPLVTFGLFGWIWHRILTTFRVWGFFCSFCSFSSFKQAQYVH